MRPGTTNEANQFTGTAKEAQTGGVLTLGPGSHVEIDPDTTMGSNGQQATSNAYSTFTPSLVELSGAAIDLQQGATIVAHGGLVVARAETSPYYQASAGGKPSVFATYGTDSARIVVEDGAAIDVSGTTSTVVSGARNFVTTALLGASDLADAPLQRDGPVYRSKLTFDTRSPVPILGNTSSYVDGIEKTASEQLAPGGSISLSSTGAIVTNPGSTLNVSGGTVSYTAANVVPSELLSTTGQIYTFNQAPFDIAYTTIVGAPSGAIDRWGVVPAYSPAQVSQGVVTPAYVAGQAGGSLSILTPLALLDGQLQAKVTHGWRQTAGLDPLAAASQLTLGTRVNGSDVFGSEGFVSAVLGDLSVVANPSAPDPSFWSNPTTAAIANTSSRIAASTINASGLGRVTVSSNGGVTVAGGANLNLPVGGSLDMLAAGSGGIEIGADFNAASGSFSAATGTAGVGSTTIGGITLDSGRSIDVSALWVNRAIDGANAQAAAAGGNVTLSSATSLDLLASSRIDVSGGATVGTSGKVASTAAGSITLNSNLFRSDQTTPASPIHIGAALIGDSISGGGALTISADSLTIGAKPIPGGIADGAGVGSLQLSSAFFDLGSFSSYNLNARSAITVAPGTSIAPQAKNWLPSSVASAEPTGTDPASFLALGSLPESQRAPTSLVLSAQTLVGTSVAYGDLSLGRGASITTDPLASVTLNAGASLAVNGSIDAPGGNVSVALVGANLLTPLPGGQTALSLGPQAIIDVSGTVVLQPQTGPLPIGTVLAGGNVLLGVSRNTRYAPVLIAPGAVIAADGSSASIGVATTSPDGTVTQSLQKVASAGGSITVVPSSGGGVLGGTLHALAGGPGVSGGSFRLAQPADGSAPIGAPASVVVQQEPVSGASAVPDVVTVSAQTLAQNFSDATLQAGNQIRFAGDVNLAMAGNLMLDAPALVASGQTRGVDVSAASSLQLGASYQAAVSPAGAIGGTAALTLGSGLVELFGHQVVQGFSSISIDSASELRLESVGPLSSSQGDFAVQGSLKLSAQQVVPTTATSFLVDAPGHSVLVTGGDSSAAVPLSAQSSLTINAADISLVDPNHPEAYGVLRSPFGSIGLNASDRITLGSGSLISVSGAGTTVPYGETTGGMGWTYNQSNPVNAPAQKAISLNAPTVDIGAGSTLDLSGGGALVAQEFVPGIGGSRNIFAGAAGGAFAVVPASGAYAAQDTDILRQADSSQKTAALQLGRDISFGSGGPIPAGTYAVLPAQYATLPGAFLVTPAASSAPLVLGAAVPRPTARS